MRTSKRCSCSNASADAGGNGSSGRRKSIRRASCRDCNSPVNGCSKPPMPQGTERASMPPPDLTFDVDEAVDRLVRFLSIEGVTGQEAAIGKVVMQALVDAGIPRKAIHFDRAHERIPVPT